MPGEWGYTRQNGPHTWEKVAPIANGKRQSPIDIEPANATYEAKLTDPALRWTYSPGAAKTLSNTGLSALMTYDSEGSCLQGGPLADKYKIAQFHLHWGQTSSTGSEHRVNGKMYAAELHIVHWNSDKYSSFSEAADKGDGLCVLGFFLQAGGKDHMGLKKMTDLLKTVPNCGDTVPVSGGFDPLCLFPDNKKHYWTYLGSLTTPPLYESVTWVVFCEPITVSEAQLNEFRALSQSAKDGPEVKDEFKGKICENYRPPQPLEGRPLRCSFH